MPQVLILMFGKIFKMLFLKDFSIIFLLLKSKMYPSLNIRLLVGYCCTAWASFNLLVVYICTEISCKLTWWMWGFYRVQKRKTERKEKVQFLALVYDKKIFVVHKLLFIMKYPWMALSLNKSSNLLWLVAMVKCFWNSIFQEPVPEFIISFLGTTI